MAAIHSCAVFFKNQIDNTVHFAKANNQLLALHCIINFLPSNC